MISIKTITGTLFAEMIISGANNLYNNKDMVDELNVFPVPDGDTGTNMSLTISAVAGEAAANKEMPLYKTADAMSFAALRGARGNSGVILSQFFRGISKSLKGKEECSAIEIADALQQGAKAAYKAVMKPTEGTILTVAKEAAKAAMIKAMTEEDIVLVFEKAVEDGNKALAKTTEQLPALQQAGVVDAGGQGWMFVLEGILEYLKTGVVTERSGNQEENLKQKPVRNERAEKDLPEEEIKFKYCTEFLIEKYETSLNPDDFKASISEKGDCMLVIDDEDVIKVHIHTNHPGFVLEEAVKLGELINIKIDNMKHQHNNIISNEKAAKVKVVAKTKQKKTRSEVVNKEYGFAAVSSGKGFLGILKNLAVDRIIEGGQTMNPSAEDIMKAVAKINANNIFVFPNNKNIIMAAEQAARLSDKNILVIPTRNIPQCISAMISFDEKKDAETNKKTMLRAMKNVETGQITYAVRDTVADGKEIKKGDILGIIGSSIICTGKNIEEVAKTLADRMTDEDTEFVTVYYGKGIKPKNAETFGEELEKRYPDAEISVQYGGQPVYYYIISAE